MIRALVTHSYFYKLDAKQWKFKQPYPPIGSLQAAAVLRNSGIETHFFDVALTDGPESIQADLYEKKPDVLVIYDDGFNYLTKMCLTVMREAAIKMTSLAKMLGIKIVICSSDASDHYEKYLLAGADFIVRGEGEETLKELLLSIQEKNDCSSLQGIAFQANGKVIVNPHRPVMRHLDELPLPAWEMINLEPYRQIWRKHHGYFSLNIATTRGCPYKCNWCAKPIYGNRYNSRSPEHVVKEIEYLIKNFQPDHFWMSDDIFGLKPGWVKRFSEIVAARKLKFKYKIQSRVDLLLEEDTIDALVQSGIETVWVGAESGSQKILDAMEKGTTVEQINGATKNLKAKGVRVGYFLQFGYTGETKADIDKTIAMTLQNMPDEIGISVSYPLPGTKFFDRVKSELLEKKNWTDSDDLAMMYHATYPPAFYKLLHRYVHSRYRIKRGWDLVKRMNFSVRPIASMFYHAPLSMIQSWKLSKMLYAD